MSLSSSMWTPPNGGGFRLRIPSIKFKSRTRLREGRSSRSNFEVSFQFSACQTSIKSTNPRLGGMHMASFNSCSVNLLSEHSLTVFAGPLYHPDLLYSPDVSRPAEQKKRGS